MIKQFIKLLYPACCPHTHRYLTICPTPPIFIAMAKPKKQRTGMHPTLEQPKYFPDLHASFNVYIRDWLAPRLPECYTISVERGLSMVDESGASKQYRPDILQYCDIKTISAYATLKSASYPMTRAEISDAA